MFPGPNWSWARSTTPCPSSSASAGPVDFVHVDCDLYRSTKTVLDHIGTHLHPGSIVVFDEYFNYPGWQEHEHRAWSEYVEQTGLRFEYVGHTVDHEQVIVRVLPR